MKRKRSDHKSQLISWPNDNGEASEKGEINQNVGSKWKKSFVGRRHFLLTESQNGVQAKPAPLNI